MFEDDQLALTPFSFEVAVKEGRVQDRRASGLPGVNRNLWFAGVLVVLPVGVKPVFSTLKQTWEPVPLKQFWLQGKYKSVTAANLEKYGRSCSDSSLPTFRKRRCVIGWTHSHGNTRRGFIFARKVQLHGVRPVASLRLGSR